MAEKKDSGTKAADSVATVKVVYGKTMTADRGSYKHRAIGLGPAFFCYLPDHLPAQYVTKDEPDTANT